MTRRQSVRELVAASLGLLAVAHATGALFLPVGIAGLVDPDFHSVSFERLLGGIRVDGPAERGLRGPFADWPLGTGAFVDDHVYVAVGVAALLSGAWFSFLRRAVERRRSWSAAAVVATCVCVASFWLVVGWGLDTSELSEGGLAGTLAFVVAGALLLVAARAGRLVREGHGDASRGDEPQLRVRPWREAVTRVRDALSPLGKGRTWWRAKLVDLCAYLLLVGSVVGTLEYVFAGLYAPDVLESVISQFSTAVVVAYEIFVAASGRPSFGTVVVARRRARAAARVE